MAASREHRVSTVMQRLGQPLYEALGVAGDELFVDDYAALQGTMAYRAVEQMLFPAAAGEAAPGTRPLDRSTLQAFEEQARSLDRRLRETQENEMLLAGLAGRFIPPGAGGDLLSNTEVRSGRTIGKASGEE